MSRIPAYAGHREHLGRLVGAALTAIDPGAAVRRHLSLSPDGVRVGRRHFRQKPHGKIYLIALGKAAPGMARAAYDLLGARLGTGVVTALAPARLPLPDRVQVIPGGHPLPDSGSLRAGEAALDLAHRASQGDLVLALISGGGSAMAECPVPGVALDDLRRLTALLLHAGVPISAINVIRGELSLLKAGGLARAAAPAQLVSLLMSDVPGDDPASIASGPTVPRTAPSGAARRALERSGLWDAAPASIRNALGPATTPAPLSPPPHNLVAARNEDMLRAVAKQARAFGFPTHILTTRLQGEAFAVGKRLGQRLVSASRPACLLAGGETTVTLRQGGRGGRNQELALGAAVALDRHPRCALIALASDGIDGPTDAAGAWVDGETAARARAFGLDLEGAAAVHDSYPLLDRLASLLHTGPTGSNLADIIIGLAYG